jgi:hypothetical protein
MEIYAKATIVLQELLIRLIVPFSTVQLQSIFKLVPNYAFAHPKPHRLLQQFPLVNR